MNSKSPGSTSGEHAIEMVGLDNLVERPQNDVPHVYPRDIDELDDEEDNDLNEDGRSALLGPRQRTRGRERLSNPFGKYWPQVKGIVVEVRGTCPS